MKFRKSWFLTACLSFTMFFCSCGSAPLETKEITVDFSRGFQASMEGTIHGLSFAAQLTKDSQGVISAVVSEPDSLKGAEFVLDEETVQVNYTGLTLEIDSEAMPAGAVLAAVRNVFDKVGAMASMEGTLEDNLMTLEGDSMSGNFILMLDKKSGVVKSIEIAENNLQIIFNSFVYS